MLRTVTRYGVNGLVFALLGPSLFWLLYPLGPLRAWLLAEVGCHLLRYASFRWLVFPRHQGFIVSADRYVLAWMPTALVGFLTVALLRGRLARTELTLVGALISFMVGFALNALMYRKPKPLKVVQYVEGHGNHSESALPKA